MDIGTTIGASPLFKSLLFTTSLLFNMQLHCILNLSIFVSYEISFFHVGHLYIRIVAYSMW